MAIRVLLTKIYQRSTKPFIFPKYNVFIDRRFSTPSTSESDKTNEPHLNDALEDIREPELSEEEILRKRFKSRLPERIYQKHVAKEPTSLDTTKDFEIKNLRKHYGRFGEASRLNPGLCWPTREEMLETMHYDAIFEPPLHERIQNVEARRLAVETQRREYEAEVDKNMGNLDKWIEEYHSKIAKKEEKAREVRANREKLVEEISEYLGYDIDPKDPRFKEAVEQKEKEKKKAMKVKKQQESYDKMLEKLKKIAQNK